MGMATDMGMDMAMGTGMDMATGMVTDMGIMMTKNIKKGVLSLLNYLKYYLCLQKEKQKET